jgi:hypothetical protein
VICLPDVQHERRRRYLERSREKGSFPSIDQMPEQRRRVPELTAEIVATFDQQGRWLADNFWDRSHLRDGPCIHSNVRLGGTLPVFRLKHAISRWTADISARLPTCRQVHLSTRGYSCLLPMTSEQSTRRPDACLMQSNRNPMNEQPEIPNRGRVNSKLAVLRAGRERLGLILHDCRGINELEACYGQTRTSGRKNLSYQNGNLDPAEELMAEPRGTP